MARLRAQGWLIILLALPIFGLASYFVLGQAEYQAVSYAYAAGVDTSRSFFYNSQTYPLLQAALNPDPNPIKGGGDVKIVDGKALEPETGPLGSRANIEDKPKDPGAISLYIVREGDNLSQIAEMFGVSINTIRWANDIARTESIRPGQTLIILPISGVQHSVEKGETLSDLAELYDADEEDIARFNGLDESAILAVGDVVTIPGGEISAAAPANATYTSTPTYSGSTVAASSYFIHPLPGGQKTQGIHGYNGVDIAAPYGTPIVAAASGQVIVSSAGGWGMGYGNYIVIEHPNGTQTLYAHLSSNAVWGGGSVVAGQVIGYVGSTGRSTGNHLHVEVRGAANPF